MPRLLDHHKIIFGEGLSIQTGFHHLKGYVRVPTWTLSPHLVVHRQQHHRQHSTSTKFRPLVTVWVQHKNLKKNMLILSWTSRKTNSWLKEKNRVHCVHLPSSLSDQMIPSKAAVLKPVGQSSAGMICEKLLGSLVVKKNCSYSIWVLANANTRWCPIPYLGFIMFYSRHIYDMYICIYIYTLIFIRM